MKQVTHTYRGIGVVTIGAKHQRARLVARTLLGSLQRVTSWSFDFMTDLKYTEKLIDTCFAEDALVLQESLPMDDTPWELHRIADPIAREAAYAAYNAALLETRRG